MKLWFSALILCLAPLNAASAGEATHRVGVSVITDWETVLYYGSPEVTKQVIDDRMDEVKNIYKRELGLDVIVDVLQIPTSADTDFIPKDTNPNTLLIRVSSYREQNPELYATAITVLVTSRTLTQNKEGIAQVNGLCSSGSVAIATTVKDKLADAILISHEMGHVFGATHDGEGDSSCPSESAAHVMGNVGYNFTYDTFSECSKTVIKKSFDKTCVEPVNLPLPTPTVDNTPASTGKSGGGGGSMEWGILLMLGLLATKKLRHA